MVLPGKAPLYILYTSLCLYKTILLFIVSLGAFQVCGVQQTIGRILIFCYTYISFSILINSFLILFVFNNYYKFNGMLN
jgi:hypothetical protein